MIKCLPKKLHDQKKLLATRNRLEIKKYIHGSKPGNPKMMLSKGGNMSNDPYNRLAVTTNRQITCTTIIYFDINIHFNWIFNRFNK